MQPSTESILRTEKHMTQFPSMRLVDHQDFAPGLFALHLDLPGEKINKLSPAVMEELNVYLDSLKQRKDIKALVILSEKETIFIAGADIQVIKGVTQSKEGESLAGQGQAVIQKLEEFSFPTIAAIHGACMGGGTELALCCKYIVVSDSPSTKIGLPEVGLGILPGFGGTVRLPKRIGLQHAMDYILTGKTMNAEKAVKLGLALASLPYQDFKTHALNWAASIARGEKPKSMQKKATASAALTRFALEQNPIGRAVLFSQARKMVMKKTRGNYPAPLKIIEALSDSYGRPKKEALAIENKAFGELVVTEISKRLIELFYLTEKVKKQTGVEGSRLETKDQIRSIGLLGAGVMGGGIAQLLAHKGIPIRVRDINYQGLALGLSSASKLFDDLVKKKKLTKREAELKLALISSTTEYSGFGQADLIIEAVVENMDVKKQVLREIERHTKSDVIFASNTSSLSITELAVASSKPENVVGMHFFNPVHKMPLVEVIRGKQTSDRAVLRIFELSKRLGKTPIVVKDGAGFLVNRLLMPYLNEACYLMLEGAPIELLDKTVLDFGMPMGPATLLDEIGIDVAAKVAKILHLAFGSRAEPCELNNRLVEAKLLGKKSLKGFYNYDQATKKQEALNPEIYQTLAIKPIQPTTDQQKNWIPRMIYLMINEAALCLDEGIVSSPQDVDLGMIMGTGFPPFRGGLLRYADAVGIDAVVKKLEELAKGVGPRFIPSHALSERAKRGQKFYNS